MDRDTHELSRDEISAKVEKVAQRAETTPVHLHDEIAAVVRKSAENIKAGRPPLDPPDR